MCVFNRVICLPKASSQVEYSKEIIKSKHTSQKGASAQSIAIFLCCTIGSFVIQELFFPSVNIIGPACVPMKDLSQHFLKTSREQIFRPSPRKRKGTSPTALPRGPRPCGSQRGSFVTATRPEVGPNEEPLSPVSADAIYEEKNMRRRRVFC